MVRAVTASPVEFPDDSEQVAANDTPGGGERLAAAAQGTVSIQDPE